MRGSELVARPESFVVETFGNTTLLVRCASRAELAAAVACAHGSLGASVYAATDGSDDAAFAEIVPLVVARAGRVVENRMPTGLAVTPVLRASHISPWSDDTQNRLNPSNGILLAATYDAAFDQHLMSFDEDGRMVLSPTLKEHHGNEAFNETFLKLEGRALAKPTRHAPSAELMARRPAAARAK